MLTIDTDHSRLWDERKFHTYVSCVTVSLAVATAALLLRVWVRMRITMRFGTDDWILVWAHITNIIACTVWLYLRRLAMDVEDDSEESHEVLSNPCMATLALYVTAGIALKISIALWFLSTARSAMQRYIILAPLGLYLLSCTVSFFLVLFRCGTPISTVRILNFEECTIGPDLIQYASWIVAVLNSSCDWVFATVPLYTVVKSQSMTRTTRIYSSALIGLAVLGSIVSVLRLPFLGAARFGPHFLSEPVTAIAYMLSLIETAVGVTTISLATLQPLLAVVRRRWSVFRSRSDTRSMSHPDAPYPCHRYTMQAISTENAMKSTVSNKVVLIDSHVLGGIGILPNVSVDDDELDDGGFVQFLPRRPSRVASVRVEPISNISEVLYSDLPSPRPGKKGQIGDMV